MNTQNLKWMAATLAIALAITFTNCTKEPLNTEATTPETTTENLHTITAIDNAALSAENPQRLSSPSYWRKYIERIATEQQFDFLEIIDQSGQTLHKWSVFDLKIDYSSPKELVLHSKSEDVRIKWTDIMSISKVADKTISEQLMTKTEAYQ